MPSAIIVSGIPASGKSTLARQIAAALDLPLLDKDDILESLFDSLGIGDAVWRQRLSRASDVVFERTARNIGSAVLASFWRSTSSSLTSGTPTDWLLKFYSNIVEVHCICDPKIAAERFLRRERHEGHLDHTKMYDGLVSQFETHRKSGPLGIGDLFEVNTTEVIDVNALVLAIQKKINAHPHPMVERPASSEDG